MVGAAYLIYLGLTTLRGLWKNHAAPQAATGSVARHEFSFSRSMREGFLSNVLNPKTAVFYLAFLPQFINPEGSAFLQSTLMASIHFVIAMVWQCGLAGALTSAKNLLKSARFMHWMEGTTGVVLVGLGVKLMLEDK